MWRTTEIGQKVYFEALILWLTLGAGLSVEFQNKLEGNPHA
jgi:hypothetical protein